MTYILLVVSVIFEVIGTALLKKTDGLANIGYSIGMVVCYAISLYLISLVVKTLPVGLIYAIWSASGIVLATFAACFLYNEKPDMPAIIGLGFIIGGVVIINLCSKMSIE